MGANDQNTEKQWRSEYEQNRYLREMDDSALDQRFQDLSGNLWSTDADGNVTPMRNSGNRKGILKLIHHTMLEKMERSKINPGTLDERAMREKASQNYSPPTLSTPFAGSPEGFAKFGKKEHVKPTFERGIIRIAPANIYINDPSLNTAQLDKELEHVVITPNERILAKIYMRDTNGKEIEAPVQWKEMFRFMMVPDFYVWCCGLGYDARLFHDFKANACIMIRNKEEFIRRFEEAAKKILPAATMQHGVLRYYDRYTTPRSALQPRFSKYVKYLYQNEYRFAWSMAEGSELKAFFVELGSLQDIAEYYEVV